MEDLNNKNIKYTPFKCPVCNGWGTVSFKRKPCQSCGGTGLVLVNQETGEIVKNSDREIEYGKSRLDKTI